jgi:hypothetical protein
VWDGKKHDARLRAVADHVRARLFPSDAFSQSGNADEE